MSKEEATKVAELGEKPGWKSTEFWGLVAAYVVALLLMSGAFPVDGEAAHYLAMAQMILGKLGYDHTRGKVKTGASQAKAMLMSYAAQPPANTDAVTVDPLRESPAA